jgi:multidrug efflux pump subunit AcrA (membrane-fusion protein)
MDKRKLIIIVSGIAIVAFSFFSMQWLSGMKKMPPKRAAKEVIRYVKAEPIEYTKKNVKVLATGRVTSNADVSLIAEVRGEIMRGDISFKVGESFKEGDLLLKIDDAIELYNMKSRKSSFLNSVAGMLPDLNISFPDEYDEWMKFMESIDVDNDLPDLPELNSTQERIFMASRNILTNYYSIKSAEANFESYHIYAPFDGTITEVSLQKGAVANPGSRLGRIINTKDLELEVPVEVIDAQWLKVGQSVVVHNSKKTSSWKGKIVRKSQNVNPTTQSINVFISINTSKGKSIFHGEYLSAEFSGIRLNNVMEIPRKTVFNENEVFIVRDSLLVKQVINIQKISREKLYFNGLHEGEYIVTEPLINATENTKVQILDKENQSEEEITETQANNE